MIGLEALHVGQLTCANTCHALTRCHHRPVAAVSDPHSHIPRRAALLQVGFHDPEFTTESSLTRLSLPCCVLRVPVSSLLGANTAALAAL